MCIVLKETISSRLFYSPHVFHTETCCKFDPKNCINNSVFQLDFEIFRTIVSFIKISSGHFLIIKLIFIKFFRTIWEIGRQMSWEWCLAESLLIMYDYEDVFLIWLKLKTKYNGWPSWALIFWLIWFDFWCLMPFSAIFQLFHGDQF